MRDRVNQVLPGHDSEDLPVPTVRECEQGREACEQLSQARKPVSLTLAVSQLFDNGGVTRIQRAVAMLG